MALGSKIAGHATWNVVGIRQARLHVEPEERDLRRIHVLVLGHRNVGGAVAEEDLHLQALFHVRTRHHIIEDRLNILLDVLEQQRQPLLERPDHLVEPALGTARHHRDEAVGLLAPADPHNCLQLRVDDEREARTLDDDRRILRRERIGGKALSAPAGRLRGVG